MKRMVLLLIATAAFLFVLSIVAGFAETVVGKTIRVIDGDTVQLVTGERIRLLDIDTPEIFSPKCRAEKEAGEKAKRRIQALLDGRTIDVQRIGEIDRYGRTLARLQTDIGDIGLILLGEGHALLWRPGPEERAKRTGFWCGGER
jgi:micrococcal nuclease